MEARVDKPRKRRLYPRGGTPEENQARAKAMQRDAQKRYRAKKRREAEATAAKEAGLTLAEYREQAKAKRKRAALTNPDSPTKPAPFEKGRQSSSQKARSFEYAPQWDLGASMVRVVCLSAKREYRCALTGEAIAEGEFYARVQERHLHSWRLSRVKLAELFKRSMPVPITKPDDF